MSYEDDILKLFANNGEDYVEAATAIAHKAKVPDTPQRELILYLLAVGIERTVAAYRTKVRREAHREIRPEYQRAKDGRIQFSTSTRERLKLNAQVFTTYMVMGVPLGRADKAQLCLARDRLKASANGQVIHARFLDALQEPMKVGQIVSEVWKEVEVARMIKKLPKEVVSHA